MEEVLIEANNSKDDNMKKITSSRNYILISLGINVLCGIIQTLLTSSKDQEINDAASFILLLTITSQLLTLLIVFYMKRGREEYFVLIRKSKIVCIDILLLWTTVLMYAKYFTDLKNKDFMSKTYENEFWLFNLVLI